MTKILVTGATGFVGSHIMKALRDAPVTVIAACRDPEKLPSWFQGEVRQGDLRENAYVDSLPKGIDIVCHAASWSSMYGNKKNVKERFLNPTLRLLEAVEREGVSRFLFPSTHGTTPIGSGRDASVPGQAPFSALWPHLQAVVTIEDMMRHKASNRLSMVNLRLGLFLGENYSLGLLPVLTNRLKTHLVPWINSGRPRMILIDGDDVGQVFLLAALNPNLKGYEAFNVVGPTIPTMRDFINYLHDKYGYPLPHFSVPFWIAIPFAFIMRALDPFVPWDPLIVPGIVHLLRDFDFSNDEAITRLGYQPTVSWKNSVDKQMSEMKVRQKKPMRMRKELN